MEVLQHANRNLPALPIGDTICSRSRGSHGCESGNALCYRSTPDSLLIKPGVLSLRSIDDELNAFSFDEINDVRTSFLNLVHALDRQARALQDVRGAVCRNDVESQLDESFSQFGKIALVAIGDADKNRAARGQTLSRRELGFRKSLAERIAYAHNFASGFHFGTENRVHARKFVPRKHRALHEIAIAGFQVGAPFNELRQELAQLAACH